MLQTSKKNKHTTPVADKAPGDWSPRPLRLSDQSPSPPPILPTRSRNFDTIPEDVLKPLDWPAAVKGLEKEIARLRESKRGFEEEIARLRELDREIEEEIARVKKNIAQTRVMIDIHQTELVKWRKNIPST